MALLAIENLSFTYPHCSAPTLQDISFSVEEGSFVAVCGATGSGKSSLLRLLKPELTVTGHREGRILLDSAPLESLSLRESACTIGYVMQKPEHQIVTDKVWHELAFGLENMHLPPKVIARRVAEMASYFGMESWFDKRVSELSGGQKQMLNLASVLMMRPKLLLLDEPTAQLDPITAGEFLDTLQRLHRDLSLTILMTEHRLEEVIPLSDQVVVLQAGTLLACDTPQKVMAKVGNDPSLLCGMPAAVRIRHGVGMGEAAPLTVAEGKKWLQETFRRDIVSLPAPEQNKPAPPALELEQVCFRYQKEQADVLSHLQCTVRQGEIYCILGGNGSGKTTALSVMAGLHKPYSGVVKVFGKRLKDYKGQSLYRGHLALLPQDVQTVFLHNTVAEELADAKAGVQLLPCPLAHWMERHPYDLSGGEQQLVALAKVLANRPRLLLLDEPTKGVDAHTKQQLAAILRKLREDGMTIVVVTHDVEFAALSADRMALFFRGSILTEEAPAAFFSENHFYTTAVSRMTRDYYQNAVTVEDAVALCLKNGRKGGQDNVVSD